MSLCPIRIISLDLFCALHSHSHIHQNFWINRIFENACSCNTRQLLRLPFSDPNYDPLIYVNGIFLWVTPVELILAEKGSRGWESTLLWSLLSVHPSLFLKQSLNTWKGHHAQGRCSPSTFLMPLCMMPLMCPVSWAPSGPPLFRMRHVVSK